MSPRAPQSPSSRPGRASSGGSRPLPSPSRSGAGSRPPRQPNYRLRRTIVFGTAGLLLALLVWAIYGLVGALIGSDASQSADSAASDAPQSAQPQIVSGHPVPAGSKVTPDGFVDKEGNITIPHCLGNDITMSLDAHTVSVGAGVTMPVTISNAGSIACTLDASRIRTVVTSGDDTYYNSGACETTPSTGLLLLRPAKTWTGSVSWDGRVYDQCTAADSDGDGQFDVAPAGTYVVRVSLGESDQGATNTLTVQ